MPQLWRAVRHGGNRFDRTRQPRRVTEKTADRGPCGIDRAASVLHITVATERDRRPGVLGSGPRDDLVLAGDTLHLGGRLGQEIRLHRFPLGTADLETVHTAQAAAVTAVADIHRHLRYEAVPRVEETLPGRLGGDGGACSFAGR